MNNPFWDYSAAVYSLDGVADICIALQDDIGLDVNVLLYAAWLASLNRRLTPSHLGAVDAEVAHWRERVVQPLRSLRRELGDYPSAAEIREDIKAVELRAEQQQQDMMYEFHCGSVELPSVDCPLQENLALVATSSGPDEACWATGIERLYRLLGG